MRERVTLVVPVRNQLALTRACLESLRATTGAFRVVVMDSGSTDGTAEFVRSFTAPFAVACERVPATSALTTVLNLAWRRADTETVCFLHNDTEMVAAEWLARLLAALETPGIGLAGLYGIKRLRKNGRYVGRTVVHSLAEGPTVSGPWEEVAVVDAVCLALSRRLLETIGGFDEGFRFHGLDRDLSFGVRERGHRAVVVLAPFRHHGGGTRTRDFARDPALERDDLAERDAALERFRQKWAHRLPCDVRTLGARVTDWISARMGETR
jgi:GT2 family glycosyltransferase